MWVISAQDSGSEAAGDAEVDRLTPRMLRRSVSCGNAGIGPPGPNLLACMKTRAMAELAASLAEYRGAALVERLRTRLTMEPRCPVGRYVMGCEWLERASPAPAARHFMIAFHAEPRFRSAALLAFAGLSWVSRPGCALLRVLIDTWEEYRRPEFDRDRTEIMFLNAFGADEPPELRGDVFARRLWRLPIRTLRAQVADAVAARNADLWPILSLPA